MADYFARLTAAGLADVNTAMLGGAALPLVDLALGDGGGVSYDPTGAENDLVNETARVPIEAIYRDPTDATILIIEAVVPSEEGGFWVREVGVYSESGDLFAIGKMPPAYKPEIGDGAAFGLFVRVRVKVSAAAQVQISELSGDFYATRDWARANRAYFAVISATITAPPGAPAAGDQYLVPAAATGAWAAQAGKIAHWRGALEGWQFIAPPLGALATIGASGRVMRLSATGWRTLAASSAEAVAALDGELLATAQGVREFFDANRNAVALASATITAPPGAPAARAAYLVPDAATGAWAAQVGKVAVWNASGAGAWVFYDQPVGSLAMAADTGAIWKRAAAGWRLAAASTAEHLAGNSQDLAATPAGVAAMIAAAVSQVGVAANLFIWQQQGF